MNRLLVFLSSMVIFTGCWRNDHINVNDVMQRAEIRDSIMNNIAASRQWVSEMLSHIKKNDSASKMTATDTDLIKRMLKEDVPFNDTSINHLLVSKVFRLASRDTDACDVTCTEFMQNQFVQERLKKKMNVRKQKVFELRSAENM